MQNIPREIYDRCPSCARSGGVLSKCTFTNEVEEVIDAEDGVVLEYLYNCNGCRAGLWVFEEWAIRNEVIRHDD